MSLIPPLKRPGLNPETLRLVALRGTRDLRDPVVSGKPFFVDTGERTYTFTPSLTVTSKKSASEDWVFESTKQLQDVDQSSFFSVFICAKNIVIRNRAAGKLDPNSFMLGEIADEFKSVEGGNGNALCRNKELLRYLHRIIMMINTTDLEVFNKKNDMNPYKSGAMASFDADAVFTPGNERTFRYTLSRVHPVLDDITEYYCMTTASFQKGYELPYSGNTNTQINNVRLKDYINKQLAFALDVYPAMGKECPADKEYEYVCLNLDASNLYMVAGLFEHDRILEQRIRRRVEQQLDGYRKKYVKDYERIKENKKIIRYRVILRRQL